VKISIIECHAEYYAKHHTFLQDQQELSAIRKDVTVQSLRSYNVYPSKVYKCKSQ